MKPFQMQPNILWRRSSLWQKIKAPIMGSKGIYNWSKNERSYKNFQVHNFHFDSGYEITWILTVDEQVSSLFWPSLDRIRTSANHGRWKAQPTGLDATVICGGWIQNKPTPFWRCKKAFTEITTTVLSAVIPPAFFFPRQG